MRERSLLFFSQKKTVHARKWRMEIWKSHIIFFVSSVSVSQNTSEKKKRKERERERETNNKQVEEEDDDDELQQ